MPFGIGMQTVSIRLMEITYMRIVHRIKPTNAIQIDHWYSPYVTGFFQNLHIFIYINSYSIRICLFRLHILSSKLRKAPMQRCQHNNLFRGKICFQIIH